MDGAGVSVAERTVVEPAVDEQPARVTAASAARHARPRHPMAPIAQARCTSCGFSVMRQWCGERLGGFLVRHISTEAERMRRHRYPLMVGRSR
jgi:hypothetical protein